MCSTDVQQPVPLRNHSFEVFKAMVSFYLNNVKLLFMHEIKISHNLSTRVILELILGGRVVSIFFHQKLIKFCDKLSRLHDSFANTISNTNISKCQIGRNLMNYVSAKISGLSKTEKLLCYPVVECSR